LSGRAASGRIRIMVVDDHEMVREGIKAILEGEPDFEIVSETGLGEEVGELAARTRPDVVLLDARLPDISGPEVCRRLTGSQPEAGVVILTTFTDDELVDACVQAGAKGYVVKDVERFWLKESIRSVSRGESVLSPQVASKLMERMRREAPTVTGGVSLNRSQVTILRLVARGYSNREIAAEMNLSENTVKTHLQGIYGKLGVRNRVEAAMLASKRHLV
jgi:DNA-binding NarL/FixJ family response regulator